MNQFVESVQSISAVGNIGASMKGLNPRAPLNSVEVGVPQPNKVPQVAFAHECLGASISKLEHASGVLMEKLAAVRNPAAVQVGESGPIRKESALAPLAQITHQAADRVDVVAARIESLINEVEL